MQFFKKFFDEIVFEHIVNETNLFAKQFFDENVESLPQHSRAHQWYDTCIDEIKMFVALLILQGVDSKAWSCMYFTKRESVCSPFYSKVMSGRRFELLQRFMHFADNTSINNESPGRKLAKIQPLLDILIPIFMKNYIPSKSISIDESLLGWKGHLGLITYMPNKRKRFGIKFYELCESTTGYVWNSFIYTGKDTVYNSAYNEMPVTSRIVFTLIDALLDKGYCLYTDNFYTSPTLGDALNERQTDIVGTVRQNRKGLPESVTNKTLQNGEFVASYRKKLMVLKWKDRKDVTLLSSIHSSATETTTSKYGKVLVKPKVVNDYNKHMGGVDLSDSLLHHFTTARNRMKKFYRKMFRHILDIAVLNSFICYRQLGGKLDRVNFIITLAENLVATYATNLPGPSTSRGRPAKIIAKPSRLIGRHFPDKCPPSAKKKVGQRKCVQCAKRKETRQSCYWCDKCQVGLCIVPCFKEWHTKQ